MSKKQKENSKRNFAKNQKPKRNVFLISFVSVFVAIAVTVGAVFGIIAISKNAKAAFKYSSQIISEELASFFASYYKYEYMSMLSKSGVDGVEDTPEFWNTKYNDENTHGDFLVYSTTEYIKQLLVASILFDNYDKLSGVEKRNIRLAAEEILDYQAEGSIDVFNENTAEFGFTYSVFDDAAEMLYKAGAAMESVFGTDGSKLVGDAESCQEILITYTRVKLLFIRTEDRFKLDENGNRIIGSDGNAETVPLTEEEKAERNQAIEEIRAAIKAYDEEKDGAMNATMFGEYMKDFAADGDAGKIDSGYYFHPNSEYTSVFAKESKSFEEIVNAAFEVGVGGCAEVKTDFGVCFVYGDTLVSGAYLDTGLEVFFKDFYKIGANYLFNELLFELSSNVKVEDRFFKNIDIINLPYNSIYYPRF